MAKLRSPREGEPLSTNGSLIPFSFWPARRSTRWAVQRRLYVKDPWATLFEAVYRSDIHQRRITEALSYLDQAEAYFAAGTEVGGRISVKPLLLYYSVLNLAKCMIAARAPELDLSQAFHGLIATRAHKRAILGDQVKIKTSETKVNIFGELMTRLDGDVPSFRDIEVRHLLPQILPAHRLWTYASERKEQFISVDVSALHDSGVCTAWLNIAINRGELAYLGKSVKQLVSASGLPGHWDQVRGTPQDGDILLQQAKPIPYKGRPLDCVDELFHSLRPSLWSVVTTTHPHRKYYLNVDSNLGMRRLPQWASVYALFFYLSDLCSAPL